MPIDSPESRSKTRPTVTHKTAEPPMYKVLLHNDDYTTKAFVVEVLVTVFHKSTDDATRLMWKIHKSGTGVGGVYPFEVAETKAGVVTTLAQAKGFPLRISLEEE